MMLTMGGGFPRGDCQSYVHYGVKRQEGKIGRTVCRWMMLFYI